MERIPEMQEWLRQSTVYLLEQRLLRMQEIVCSEKHHLKDRLQAALLDMVHGEVPEKPWKQLTLSYLRSSYLTGSHSFLLSRQGEILFLEEELPEKVLDLSELFRGVEEDLRRLEAELKQKFIRVTEGEQESIRRWYYELLYGQLRTVIELALSGNIQEEGIPVLYGEYMGEYWIIGLIWEKG